MNKFDTPTPAPRPAGEPLPGGWLALLLNWLLPGAGFFLAGRRARGLTQTVLVFVTFILGLMLHAGVAWPSWSPNAQDFNLINNFSFIIQLGAGLPALLSLAAQQFVAPHPALTLLAGIPQHPYYELGSYYLIVAGAINYFALCNLFDRLIRPQSRYLAQEQPQDQEEAQS